MSDEAESQGSQVRETITHFFLQPKRSYSRTSMSVAIPPQPASAKSRVITDSYVPSVSSSNLLQRSMDGPSLYPNYSGEKDLLVTIPSGYW